MVTRVPLIPEPPDELSAQGSKNQFDLWLQDELKKLYDPTLDEPVPDHLIDLLNAITAQPSPDDDKR